MFLGNMSVCEQLNGREKAGKLECSKTRKVDAFSSPRLAAQRA